MSEGKNIGLNAEKSVFIDGHYWFVALNYNILCKMHAETGKVELVEEGLGGEEYWQFRRYSLAETIERKLVLLPQYAEKVLIYNIDTKEFDEFAVDVQELKGKNNGGKDVKFRSSAVIGDSVWILPQSAHHILEYNTKTNEVHDYTAWYKVVEQYDWHDVNLFGFGIMVEKKLWLPCYQLNALVEFDTMTKKAKLHMIGRSDNRFTAIAYAKEKFWLIDNVNQELATWRPDKGLLSVNKAFPDLYGTDEKYLEYQWANVADLRPYGNGLIASPCMANSFLWIDKETEEISVLAEKPIGESYIQPAITEEGKACYFSQNGNTMMVMDVAKKKAEKYMQMISVRALNGVLFDNVIYETDVFSLNWMLDAVLER